MTLIEAILAYTGPRSRNYEYFERRKDNEVEACILGGIFLVHEELPDPTVVFEMSQSDIYDDLRHWYPELEKPCLHPVKNKKEQLQEVLVDLYDNYKYTVKQIVAFLQEQEEEDSEI